MWKRLIFILLLAGSFVVLLFLKPWKTKEVISTRIIDRLPVATIIGQSNLLKLSQDLSKTLYYYNIPFRDVLSPNIILSRSKKYGLDSQKPVYFFVNDSISGGDWGVIISVSDINKIELGIQRISKSIEIRDTLLNGRNLVYSPEFNLYFTYEEDWFFVYKGEKCSQVLDQITSAKRKEIKPRWKKFLKNIDFKQDILVVSIKSVDMKKYGVESSLIRLNNDSSHITLNTIVKHYDTIPFQVKEDGKGFPKREFTRQLINLNLDIDYFKKHPEHPYHSLIHKYSSKISFPMADFWDDFNGNIAFRRGGIEYIREKYIVSELDDDFNVTDVTKSRKVKITSFSLFLNTNKSSEILFNKIKHGGIITEDRKRNRFMSSPPFYKHLRDSSMIFYTSHYEPVVNPLINNQVLWTINYTPVQFYIDSTSTKVIYGRVKFPLKKIISDYFK